MIGIYNKGEITIEDTFIEKVLQVVPDIKVCENLCKRQPCEISLQECEIAVVHIYQKDWNLLIDKYSPPNSVRVRVSTGGFPDAPPPSISANNVYTLHLVPPTDRLEKAEWKKILDGLSHEENVKALVDGGDPNGLRRFFVYEVRGHLAALSILCQGYLAVHADDITCHKNIGNDLDLMRWTDLQNSASHTDLGDKKSEVQQPAWWLRAFERESFCDAMKKDWQATTGSEELTDELTVLLDAILNHESVDPKIVADAYCVLATQKINTVPKEWEVRRSYFNHYWLKNQYLIVFGNFIRQLGKPKPDFSSVRCFLKHDFPDWESHREDARWIVNSFENSFSPRRFLSCPPLNRCDAETQAWLGDVAHGMWLLRSSVMVRLKECQDALATVDKLYEKVAHNLPPFEALRTEDLAKLKSLRPEFCKLEKTFRTLKTLFETLGKLSDEV